MTSRRLTSTTVMAVLIVPVRGVAAPAAAREPSSADLRADPAGHALAAEALDQLAAEAAALTSGLATPRFAADPARTVSLNVSVPDPHAPARSISGHRG